MLDQHQKIVDDEPDDAIINVFHTVILFIQSCLLFEAPFTCISLISLLAMFYEIKKKYSSLQIIVFITIFVCSYLLYYNCLFINWLSFVIFLVLYIVLNCPTLHIFYLL